MLSSELYEYGAAYSVNDNGIAVGWVDDLPKGTVRMPAYFTPDGNIFLISELLGEATTVNSKGQIAGFVDSKPFIYDQIAGSLKTFELLTDDIYLSGQFSDISDNGVAVGYLLTLYFGTVPIIYSPQMNEEYVKLADVLQENDVDPSFLAA